MKEEKVENIEELDEEELMRRAQELSMQDAIVVQKEHQKKEEQALIQDPSFVNELLNLIPGLEGNDEAIKKH